MESTSADSAGMIGGGASFGVPRRRWSWLDVRASRCIFVNQRLNSGIAREENYFFGGHA